jgi:integrase
MARQIHRLNTLAVARAKQPGRYADGGGLCLQVSGAGAKSWIFRYMRGRTEAGRPREREMGLGSLGAVSLAEARQLAQDARKLLAQGTDPLEAREAARAAQRAEEARGLSFEAAAESYIQANAPGWRNPKHRAQWKATLATYAFPTVGGVSVSAVDVGMVVKVLEPIWTEKPETASRVRGRIEAVLDWATARGLRTGDNPARWRGHLSNIFPRRTKVARVKHHEALPYAELAQFVAELRAQDGIASRALEFAILTAARTSEVTGATWQEFNLDGGLWTVPAGRIKAGKEHRVPLSPRALAILRDVAKLRNTEESSAYVFPGGRRGKPLSESAMLALLKRMDRAGLTVHGFRSTFRDWSAECGSASAFDPRSASD